ncbi:MAG: prepilin-type N-terminal cleavage/methylation domain-containing protein [Phycisphaerales bacterium]|nr:MAG: prepilin-type N-terminal cleavage/methylation domain-containing protein [Phycisphaerales bacterium]
MPRRGFTLLELLIAIALLLALGALSLPAIMGQLDERRFESAVELTTSHLLLARAHAQATGRTVEVLYRFPPARLEARIFQPGEMSEGDPSDWPSNEGIAGDEEGEETGYYSLEWDEEQNTAGLIHEGWALRALPAGIRLSSAPPDGAEGLLAEWSEFEEESWGEGFSPPVEPMPAEEDDDPVTIRLAVFLPDGSALICEPAWLWDRNDHLERLTVNPWSGLPQIQDDDLVGESQAREDLAEESPGTEDSPFTDVFPEAPGEMER